MFSEEINLGKGIVRKAFLRRKQIRWSTALNPSRRRAFRGFGQYQAGDYSTDMWKGSIYQSSPINTSSNWLGSLSNILTTVGQVAASVVPSIMNYRTQQQQISAQKKIEEAKLAIERQKAQAESQYYQQLLAMTKQVAGATTNQTAGIVPPTTILVPSTSLSAIPSGSTGTVVSEPGRAPMVGGYAFEAIPTQIDLKKYLPFIGIGILVLLLLRRRETPQPVVVAG